MSADWQVGDLAVCVDASPCRCIPGCGISLGLVNGHIYRVLAVLPAGNGADWDNLDVGLGRIPMHRFYGACVDRFRKIRPDEHTQCEPEFVTLLQRSRKRVSA